MNKKAFSILIFIFIITLNTLAQKKGCTDIQASNYDATAQINDGSCIYPATSYTPHTVCIKLSDTLIESSGLIYYNHWFWTINDSGNGADILAFDSITGKIIHQTFIKNKTNIDWEEITQDANNIYVGEFGNNTGDRHDLKIYILHKSDLKLNSKNDTLMAEEIQFHYADQISFTPANQNHNFDMEAMCVINDSIHLFSKNWVDKNTRHYVVSVLPGNYELSPRESFLVNGLITSACINATGTKIILGGYNTSNGECFMWMLWDFKNNLLFNGNKRKISLGSVLSMGQYEATTFKSDQLYFTNEKKYTEAALWHASINQWFTSSNSNKISKLKPPAKFTAYQKEDVLIIETSDNTGIITLYNSSGLEIINQKIKNEKTMISIMSIPSGIYTIKVNGTSQKILIER